jgi:hypothetical protein
MPIAVSIHSTDNVFPCPSPPAKLVKGSLTRDFRSHFFFMNQCPPGPKYSNGAVLNFFENSRRYSRINVYHGGTLIYEKNLKSKISCKTPFKSPIKIDTLAFGFFLTTHSQLQEI